MLKMDDHTGDVIFTIVVFAAVGLVFYLAGTVVLLLVFAVLFSYLLDPMVTWFQRQSWVLTRGMQVPAILLVYLIFTVAPELPRTG
jgi:predicted PurR-regulated permease PerM